MSFHTVTTIEETYKGWTVRLEYRPGYGHSWVAWKDGQLLESTSGYLQSHEQSRQNAHWTIDQYEAARRIDNA
jgi:hypothetical protein